MSATTAKATRRDLRRALGTVAVEALPQHAHAINQLTTALDQTRLQLDRLAGVVADIRGLSPVDLMELAMWNVWRQRNFLGRLRWLVLGK